MSLDEATQPGTWNPVIYQGTTFDRTFEFDESVDIRDLNFRGGLFKDSRSDSTVVDYEFTVIDANHLNIHLSATTTESLSQRDYYQEVEAYFTDNDSEEIVVRLAGGTANVTRS